MRGRALAISPLLAGVLALGGCGGSSGPHTASTPGHTLTAHAGKDPYYTSTRTVEGKTETLYIHPHHAVSSATTRHIETGEVPDYGLVLVNGSRHALYAFVPERYGSPACTGACATVWPPLRITIEGTLDSSPVLEESLAGTEPDPEHHAVGDRIAMFAGHVVHTYNGDTSPLTATGQGLRSFGGHWYLIAPSGKPITGRRG